MTILNNDNINGLKTEFLTKKPKISIEEIEKILMHDKPQGNNLTEYAGIVCTDDEEDYAEYEKKYVRG